MKGDIFYPDLLIMVLIPQVTDALKKDLNLKEEHKACAVLTATIDDFVYIAIDEATKKADVDATYAISFYGGNPNSSSKLQGEGFGVIAGKTVSSVQAGIDAIYALDESKQVYAVSCNDEDNIAYLVYTIASIGTYFSETYNIQPGSSMAYLVGPTVESLYAADAADKVSGAKLVKYFAPPTETNSGGALFVGTQSECVAACDAFANAVQEVADRPIYGR